MRKIDILNFITDFRKAPNDIKTMQQISAHLKSDEQLLLSLLEELKQARVVRETELNGERAFQVIAR